MVKLTMLYRWSGPEDFSDVRSQKVLGTRCWHGFSPAVHTRRSLRGPLKLQLQLLAGLNFHLPFGEPCALVRKGFMFSWRSRAWWLPFSVLDYAVKGDLFERVRKCIYKSCLSVLLSMFFFFKQPSCYLVPGAGPAWFPTLGSHACFQWTRRDYLKCKWI